MINGNIDLTPLFQVLITIITLILTIKVIPWIKSKLDASNYALLVATTKVLVYAAEQLYGAGGGKDKLFYVKGKLKEQGFDVDIDVIEAMVKELSIEQELNEQMQPEMQP